MLNKCGLKKKISLRQLFDKYDRVFFSSSSSSSFFFSPSVFPKSHGVKAVANKKEKNDHRCSDRFLFPKLSIRPELNQFIGRSDMHRILSCCLSPRLANSHYSIMKSYMHIHYHRICCWNATFIVQSTFYYRLTFILLIVIALFARIKKKEKRTSE